MLNKQFSRYDFGIIITDWDIPCQSIPIINIPSIICQLKMVIAIVSFAMGSGRIETG